MLLLLIEQVRERLLAAKVTEQELKATSVLSLTLDEVSAKVRTGPPKDDEPDYELPVWAGVVPVGATRWSVGTNVSGPGSMVQYSGFGVAAGGGLRARPARSAARPRARRSSTWCVANTSRSSSSTARRSPRRRSSRRT